MLSLSNTCVKPRDYYTMKLKFTKLTIQSIKAVLFLLVLLILVLQVQHHSKSKGKVAIENFLQSLGVTK